MSSLEEIRSALAKQMPAVFRWAGEVAKELRKHNVAIDGKSSGSPMTDALTLADLTVQELLVAALRDTDPVFRTCRIEAEETTGDLARFATDAEYCLSLDPIDGTKAFRDQSGNAYSVMLHLRDEQTVHYSLVYSPEMGSVGSWVEADGNCIRVGSDDPSQSARDVLDSLPDASTGKSPAITNKVYVIGFQDADKTRAESLAELGLEGVVAADMPASIYELMANREFIGSLIHTPNVYDFPVSLQIARIQGGDALWVHDRQPVHFRETWLDDRANMLRLPGIVACSRDETTRNNLCEFTREWNPKRYQAD